MTTLIEQAHDYFIKGLQVNRCYKDDWNYIQGVFKNYGLDLNEHSPIITMNEYKNVKTAQLLTNKICDYPELTSYNNSKIFLTLLRALPIFTRQHSCSVFEKLVCSRKPYLLHELMEIDGTIKSSDPKFEKLIRENAFVLSKRLEIKIIP